MAIVLAIEIITCMYICIKTQVYSELEETPYQRSGADRTMALTKVVNVHFPEIHEWLVKLLEKNRVCHYSFAHLCIYICMEHLLC